MASGGISAQGTKFKVGDTATDTTDTNYTEVADVEDISGPSETNRFIEITNHASSAVERLASLNDPGTVGLTLSFQPDAATHGGGSSGLRGLLRAQTKRIMRIVYPTTGTDLDQFQGIVSSFNVNAPTADVLRADCEVQITGAITSTTSS